MFSSLKVGTKLGLGFGAAILLLLAISVIGITRMEQINASVEMAAKDRWPKTVLLNHIVQQSSQIAIALRNMLLTTSRDDMQKQKERVIENRQAIGAAVEQLERVVNLPKGREMLSQLKNYRQKYIAGQERLIQLIESGKTDEARLYLQEELRPILHTYQEQVLGFAKYQGDLMEAAARESDETFRAARNLMFTLAAVAVALASILAILITRNILRQLGGEPEYAASIARQVATGDLTQEIAVKPGDKDSLLAAMKHMVDHLAQTIGEVRTASAALSAASGEVSSTSQALAQAANEQASSLEETTSAMEEIAASFSQNTENARVTDGIANQSAENANSGGEAVRATVAAMKAIAGKVGIIDDIAYQTNLLALNAAIEAARAGEHGKGFAVVAAEVRKLAERSQVAAQEIGELADSSVKTAEKAGGLLEEIVPSIRRTAELVQEIAAASGEQAAGAGQINTAMSQLNQTTQQNASASEELSATAEELSSQAGQLQHLMTRFKIDSRGQIPSGKAIESRPGSRPAKPEGPARPQPGGTPGTKRGDFVSF